MYADVGFFLMFSCCILSVYGFFSSFFAARLRHRRLYLSAKYAATLSMTFCILASVLLWVMFFSRDYSVFYIFKNSSNDLPQMYTLSAFWSSLEGSHLLWTLFLSIFTGIALWVHAKDNEHIMPYVSASLQGILSWMFFLCISYSDPFTKFFPTPENGQGMNALLQNPYMAIHPPTLFIGYTTLAIPFAYAMAALFYGDITHGWMKTTRRWTLVSWAFLTAGIALGGRWAYMELGWAGYWAWDPVENSSFLPWCMATALLHSLIVQEKLGQLKRLSIILAIAGFFLCFFGTFLTRSGVVSSVHSFAESPIGPNYLAFLGVLALFCCLVYAVRAPHILPAEAGKIWGVSKESALVVTQFLILTLAVIVFTGTIFPVVSEAVSGDRISIQAPYFNAFAPYIGLGLIVAIAIGNIMRYQTAKIPMGKTISIYSFLAALPLSAAFFYFGEVFTTSNGFALGAQVVGIFLCMTSFGFLSGDFYKRLKDIRFQWRAFWKHNKAYIGAYIAHVGLIVSILGFLGNYRSMHTKVTLNSGDTTNFFGYEFAFAGVKERQVQNATVYEADLSVKRDGKLKGHIAAARSKYPTKPELFHEVGIKSRFWHDLYVVMADFDKSTHKSATLEIYINPTVRIVWISIVLMVIGGLIAVFDRGRGGRSRDSVAPSWEASHA